MITEEQNQKTAHLSQEEEHKDDLISFNSEIFDQLPKQNLLLESSDFN
jgi:hypothetical protein